MKRRTIFLFLLVLALTLWFCIFLITNNTQTAKATYVVLSASPTVGATPTPSASSDTGINWSDVAIVAALIAAAVAIVGFAAQPYFTQLFANRAERKKQEREEQARKDAEAMAATKAAADRLTIQQTAQQRVENAVQSYHDALLHDNAIAFIQILDMIKPIELVNVYVQLRLHEDPRTTFDTNLLTERDTRQFDPNVLLQVMRKRFEETYANKTIDPAQAMRENTQCVLLGDPGAGKTTLLKYLTVQASKKQLTGLPELPIYIELSKFAESRSESLLDFALGRWEQFYGISQEDIRPYIEEQRKAGKILWLLDALDETGVGKTQDEREASYKRVSDAILQIATPSPKSHVVVTARSAGYRQRAPLTGFTELEVMQLRPEDIHTFIEQWFMSPSAERMQMGVELNERLEGNIRLQTLAANPLLLSLIVVLREKKLPIPELRVELYERCTQLLLTEWDKKRNIRRHSELSVGQQETLLQNVAWQFHVKNVRYLPDDEVLDTIAMFLANEHMPVAQKDLVLDEMKADNGLLKEQAEDWYGFLHLTFQEYFAALYIETHKLLDELLQHRNDPWWEEVILLYAGSTREIAPMLKKLLGHDSTCLLDDDIFSTNIVLAGRCLAARPPEKIEQVALPLKHEVIQRLFDMLLNTQLALFHQQAANTLTELGRTEKEVTNRLLSLLTDKNTDIQVAKSIAIAFSKYGERSLAVKMLPVFFDEQQTDDVRITISSAFAKLRVDEVDRVLITRILDTNAANLTRTSAINGLNTKTMLVHAPELLALLLNVQEDKGLRISLALVGRKLDDPTTRSQLFTQFTSAQTDDESKGIYALALSTLAHLDHPTLSALLVYSSDPSLWINPIFQIAALDSILHNLHSALFDDYFTHFIREKTNNTGTRYRLVQLLGMTRHDTIKAQLQNLYADATIEQELHEQIGITLYVLGDKTISLDTVELLTEARIFGSIEQYIVEQMNISTQLQMLANTKTQAAIRSGIVEVIGNASDMTAVPTLSEIALNKKTHLDVRLACIKAIGTLANDETTAKTLAELVNESQTSDEAQRALWSVSRRARVRVVVDPLTRKVKVEERV